MSGQHALNERNRLEAEIETLRAERDALVQAQIDRPKRANVLWHREHDRAEAAERALDKADAFVGSCTVSEDLADAKLSLTLMLNYCEARARVVELEKAIREDHYPCPDGCVGGCEVCLAMQKGEE